MPTGILLCGLVAAGPASSADSVIQHQHAFIVYRAILVGLDAKIGEGAKSLPEGLSHSRESPRKARSGPSAIVNSMSGSAQSARLKSPRSQSAKIERTSSRFSDIA